MLRSVAVSLGCLYPLDDSSEDSVVVLADFLRRFGVWNIAPQELVRTKEAIRNGNNVSLRKRWMEVLNFAPVMESGISIEEADSQTQLSESKAELVVLDIASSRRLGLSDSIVGKGLSTEIVKIGQLNRSYASSVTNLLDDSISSSDSQTNVWRERFSPLVDVASGIKVIDPYLINFEQDSLVWKPGFQYFLENLKKADGSQLQLSVYTRVQGDQQFSRIDLSNLVDAAFASASNIKSMEISFVDENSRHSGEKIKNYFHDRYIKFVINRHARVLALGRGLEALDSGLFDGKCRDSSFKYLPSCANSSEEKNIRRIENAVFSESKRQATYFSRNR